MDDIARYNLQRWRALTAADALFTRPYLDLDAQSARARLDPDGRLGDVSGRSVLCLAGGGGQQSAAFALLGAAVTVIDLSPEQLDRDRLVARQYGVTIQTVQADMRNLSLMEPHAFDLVWQPYSLNFVPDARVVFREVARSLRPGGRYRFSCANPFAAGLTERDWDGHGYRLHLPYVAGAVITYPDQPWVHAANNVPWPREYRHTLSGLINGLLAEGFALEHLDDLADVSPNDSAEPGSWEHFTAIVPPWLTIWAARGAGG
ncbi:MAG: class I SAM-dependent methyltransferase [Anaerolineales bacterium]|nr:class I SAM-dependent methyltransferase [Anaerolineales bacterium]